MFETLIRWSLRFRSLTLACAGLLLVAGIHAWLNLPIDAFPDISPTQAKVILKIPGMTPEEVEQRVVKPIEQELLSIPNKRIVRSISKYGIADITIDFDEGVDLYWARQQVSERLNGVLRDLPASVTGGLAPITTPLSEVFMFTLEGEGFSLAEKRRVLDWVIRPELRTIPGVADLNALGGEVQTFEVVPHNAKLAALGIGMSDLRQALLANNSNDGAGRLTAGDEALVVRVQGAIQTLDDLRTLRLTTARNTTVQLDDVATVKLGALTRYGAVTHDGQGEAVEGLVLGMRGVNARQLVEEVDAKLQELQPRLPKGMTVKTFYNRGELVTRAADTVIHALVEAAVLVCITLYVFLGGMRAALVVAVALPLSLLATFMLMRSFGLTANLMSLGGLAIALGMLVDASVVVVENIETAFAAHQPGHGLSKTEILLAAVRQVVKPVVAGVLIIAVVFLPLLSLEGLEGKLFAPVAITIIMALGASLLLAFTVIPALASLLLKEEGAHEPVLMQKIHAGYLRLRERVWASPKGLYGVSLLSLVVAVGLYTQIGKTFMPTLDEGDILVQLEKTPSISLDASLEIDTRVQQAILQAVPEVKSIVARVGSDELGLDPMGLNETDTFLVLKPKAEWRGSKDDIINSLRTVLDGFPGLVYGFTQPIEMRVSEMLTGTRGDVAIKIFGADLNAINTAAHQIADAVRQVPGAAEVIAPKAEGLQYLTVGLNRTAIGQAGFSVEGLQQAFKNQVEGEALGYVLQNGVRTPLMLKGNEATRQSAEAFKNLPLAAPDGRVWAASALADIRMVDGPIRVNHEQSARFTSIQVSVDGRDLAGFVQDAQAAVAALKLPTELRVVWGGQFENQQRAAARLGLVIPAAMVLIFTILVFTFGSAIQAGIIFLNIPFALVGGVVALAVSGEYLSVPASVGFIALLGIAVLNGVVMVTHFNERLLDGEAMDVVVRLGTERRLRPVLMTAVITALGMIPLLFATGPGSEIQRPLAIVVTGGLLSSTLLTLLLLPKLFERFGGMASVPWSHLARLLPWRKS
ncbi:CusA/CzcA family heavy metal efflux RND transporter [Limnohabitans sp. TS-CS-82]|uniref:efflux RND transporter permease subunit n=1 Tax=Limnohabitans sp. TS-CS-82 TaxID=2094193 RepID=UPI000CF24630|nr:CusA/CzcA family heavy metal efflux RND transporter [Limnohabitans sp. TS-CS-82]PQA83040.1 CusA/CzcA family heavy metal efflux RND transporter [Limnohabitans sp. TS-CS-82]